MKIVADGPTGEDVRIYDAQGNEVSEDLGLTSITLHIEGGRVHDVEMHCNAKGFVIDTLTSVNGFCQEPANES